MKNPSTFGHAPRTAPVPVGREQILTVARSVGVLGGSAGGVPRIMAALCDPEVEPKQVKALLEDEPALYARVLKVANSALYGQVQPVGSLDRALFVLGLDAVRGIAAAGCLDRSLAHGGAPLLDLESVVNHSQATAAAADALARSRFPDLVSEAFIAGLLHNLGTVVQMNIDPTGVQSLLAARLGGDTRALTVLERDFALIGHEECGAVIFEEWRLPSGLVAAARYHHSPLSAPERDRRLTALINVSSAIAIANGSTLALEPHATPPGTEVLHRLDMDQEQLTEATQAIADRMAIHMQALQAA